MLGQITYRRLHIIVDYEKDGREKTHTFGNKGKSAADPEATLIVKSQAAWLRLCSNLDAVVMI
jgi:hypothetical protein